jgi:hypothetical protein
VRPGVGHDHKCGVFSPAATDAEMDFIPASIEGSPHYVGDKHARRLRGMVFVGVLNRTGHEQDDSMRVQENTQGKKRDIEAKTSKHASQRVHACARARDSARARVCARACARVHIYTGGI